MATLGLDYVSKTYTPEGASQELQVKIWDTAGQERFRTLTHAFYKQANGVVVAFDVTSEDTFKNVAKWMESIFEHADQNICKVMVGNKIDLEDERKISKNEAEQLASKYHMKYFEASAKQDIGISAFFETLMTEVYHKRFSEEPRKTFSLQPNAAAATEGDNQPPPAKKGGCC